MPGMKRFRRNGREEPISLDDEMFRLLPEDGDPTLDRDDDWDRSRANADDFGDGDMDYAPGLGGDPAARFGERRSVMTLLSALVILVVVAAVVWYLVLGPAPDHGAPDEIQTAGDPATLAVPAAPSLPVVPADTDPYKVRPDDPGGLQVQNTDMRVYDRLGDGAPGNEGPAIEQLLPRPSAPVAPPTPPPAPEPPPSVTVSTPSPEAGPAPTPAAVVSAAEPDPAPEPDGAADANPAPAPSRPGAIPAAEAPTPTPTPENVTVTALRGPQVQLAAFRERPVAEATWQRLSKAHPDLLGPLPHAVVFADLGDLGRFYRLRAGPLPSGEAAEQLCRSLKQRDVECLVVRE